jgi:hypothetical protein
MYFVRRDARSQGIYLETQLVFYKLEYTYLVILALHKIGTEILHLVGRTGEVLQTDTRNVEAADIA